MDYELDSASDNEAKSCGSIRISSEQKENDDSIKFTIEKNTDFRTIDVQIFLKAYEQACKPNTQPVTVDSDGSKLMQSRQEGSERRNTYKASQGQCNDED